jgi:ubiquinone biosynthesis O-methyltransferase
MTSEPKQDLGELPAAYHRWRTSELGRITDRIEEQTLLDLLGPVTGRRLLDVGCGDGALSVRLARSGAVVTGLDNAPRMLVAARRRAAEAVIPMTFVEGDAQSLPFPNCSFDIVVSVTVLCFVKEPAKALQEMARVLRPGGKLVIGELGRWSIWAAKRRIAGWFGSKTWSAAQFRSARDLKSAVAVTGLQIETVRGAVYYPPADLCARWLSSFDERLSRITTAGAAFIALSAIKPMQPPEDRYDCRQAAADPGRQGL